MMRALRLARKGLFTTGFNPRVGCVLVKDGHCIGEGWHHRCGQPHAEILAIENAETDVHDATAYVTLEPCSHVGRTGPCVDALIGAGVAQVVIAMIDPNPKVGGQGVKKLEEAGIKVRVGLLENEARRLNPGFVSRMEQQRPYVRCKIAMSLDGQTALEGGQSQWITGTESRMDVHRLRARHTAILTGAGTVRHDNPRLTVRLPDDIDFEPPIRIVVKGKKTLNDESHIFNTDAPTWVVDAVDDVHEIPGCERHIHCAASKGRVDLEAMLRLLADHEINELMIEAGPTLNGALLEAGLVDEVVIYQAVKILGEQRRTPWAGMTPVRNLQDAVTMCLEDIRQVGTDIRMTFKPREGLS
ncbi:MAG: bifunctional diaminohydroxyphosphoribosylaminopyrimidine deaminase/5-amino-6-(5-phosphoribosylamino)uracil reductase RibD [Gammaproteobacteria bacterium]|nr:MAG: bifunctional diaminohydroxyphosphoribosylaminopyrimidine deaminase/5-amino-6-(5-phosphoribosylamino)uracil reductase RibD [Gammaproteobacteria bacterium]